MTPERAGYIFMFFFALLIIPFAPIRVVNQCTSSQSQTFVAFTVDDSYTSWSTIIDPIFENHNLPITGFISDTSNGLTWNDVERLAETGRWEFGWHSTDHPLLTRLTNEEEEEQISGFIELFDEHSLPSPRAFCYPYGGYDFSTMLTVSEYFMASRTVDEGVNTAYWVSEHPMEIKVTRIYQDRDNEYYKTMISNNIGKGVFIVFYLHAVGEPIAGDIEITPGEFEELIGWAVNQDINFVSFSQGIEEMRNRDFSTKSSIVFDYPFHSHYISQIPIPSRYWEMTFMTARFFGKYSPSIGDFILKYNTFLTTFVVLSLFFCLANSIILIRRRDRS